MFIYLPVGVDPKNMSDVDDSHTSFSRAAKIKLSYKAMKNNSSNLDDVTDAEIICADRQEKKL